MRIITLSLAVLLATTPALGQPRAASPIFTFHTDEFWLNLHQFLYVLGRHQAGTPDRTRRAVAGAPVEAEKGLAALSADDQRRWRDAVAFYANGPGQQDAVFDRPLIAIAHALVQAGGSPNLAEAGIDQELRKSLEAAAPLYRKTWWTAHREANERWAVEIGSLVEQHGAAMLAFVSRAYQLPWPPAGYPVRVTAYANWAGAFSTEGNLLLISSLDPGTRGLPGLEITFHEAMHQWDEAVDAALRSAATKQNRTVPGQLSHAMIFYTAGEATRSIAPGYVPYAEANGIWRRGMGEFKPALDQAWKPYLDGKETRARALEALIARVR
jgi:hypothetical protein